MKKNSKKMLGNLGKVLAVIFVILVILYIYYVLSNTKEGIGPRRNASPKERQALWNDWQRNNPVEKKVDAAIRLIMQNQSTEWIPTITMKGINRDITLKGMTNDGRGGEREFQIKQTTAAEGSLSDPWLPVTNSQDVAGPQARYGLKSQLTLQIQAQHDLVKNFIDNAKGKIGAIEDELKVKTDGSTNGNAADEALKSGPYSTGDMTAEFSEKRMAENAVEAIMDVGSGGSQRSGPRLRLVEIPQGSPRPNWDKYQARRAALPAERNKKLRSARENILFVTAGNGSRIRLTPDPPGLVDGVWDGGIGSAYNTLSNSIETLYDQGYEVTLTGGIRDMIMPSINNATRSARQQANDSAVDTSSDGPSDTSSDGPSDTPVNSSDGVIMGKWMTDADGNPYLGDPNTGDPIGSLGGGLDATGGVTGLQSPSSITSGATNVDDTDYINANDLVASVNDTNTNDDGNDGYDFGDGGEGLGGDGLGGDGLGGEGLGGEGLGGEGLGGDGLGGTGGYEFRSGFE